MRRGLVAVRLTCGQIDQSNKAVQYYLAMI